MYTRQYEWQAPTIASQSESGWENIITLGFPCVDIRLKFLGYGWKSSVNTENEIVLYEGRYRCYYRSVGETAWEYFATVTSERASQSESYVYEDCFIELGTVPENLYEIKIIAADGEKFKAWEDSGDGVIEEISENDQFWYDLKIKGLVPNRTLPYESIQIAESLQIAVDLISFEVNDQITLLRDIAQWEISFPIELVYEILTSFEVVSVTISWPVYIVDLVTVVENVNLLVPEYSLSVYEDIIRISEAPMGYEPTLEIFALDSVLIVDNLEYNAFDVLEASTNVTILENVDLYFDVLVPSVYETNSINENISLDLIINMSSAFEVISLEENIDSYLDNLFIEEAESISATEDFEYTLVHLVEINDVISVTENTDFISILLVGIQEDISIAENIDYELIDIYIVSVFDSVSVNEFFTDKYLIDAYEDFLNPYVYLVLHADNSLVDSSKYDRVVTSSNISYSTDRVYGTHSFDFARTSANYITYQNSTPGDMPFRSIRFDVDCWVKFKNDFSFKQTIFSGSYYYPDYYWRLAVTTTETFELVYWVKGSKLTNTQTIPSPPKLNDGRWHHIALIIRFNNPYNKVGIYLDGGQIYYSESTFIYTGPTMDLNLGISETGGFYLSAYMDEVNFSAGSSTYERLGGAPNSSLTDSILVPKSPCQAVKQALNINLDILNKSVNEVSSITENVSLGVV